MGASLADLYNINDTSLLDIHRAEESPSQEMHEAIEENHAQVLDLDAIMKESSNIQFVVVDQPPAELPVAPSQEFTLVATYNNYPEMILKDHLWVVVVGCTQGELLTGSNWKFSRWLIDDNKLDVARLLHDGVKVQHLGVIFFHGLVHFLRRTFLSPMDVQETRVVDVIQIGKRGLNVGFMLDGVSILVVNDIIIGGDG